MNGNGPCEEEGSPTCEDLSLDDDFLENPPTIPVSDDFDRVTSLLKMKYPLTFPVNDDLTG